MIKLFLGKINEVAIVINKTEIIILNEISDER